MTTEQNAKYVKLLQKNGSALANAVLFYLTNTKPEIEKKKQFVEKVIDKYVEVNSVSTSRYGEWIVLSKIPQEIIFKLIFSYREDVSNMQDKDKEDLIAEMENIF